MPTVTDVMGDPLHGLNNDILVMSVREIGNGHVIAKRQQSQDGQRHIVSV